MKLTHGSDHMEVETTTVGGNKIQKFSMLHLQKVR